MVCHFFYCRSHVDLCTDLIAAIVKTPEFALVLKSAIEDIAEKVSFYIPIFYGTNL